MKKKVNENRPVVNTTDGILIRDEGLVTKGDPLPAIPKKKPTRKRENLAISENIAVVEPTEDKPPISRFDCLHQPKD